MNARRDMYRKVNHNMYSWGAGGSEGEGMAAPYSSPRRARSSSARSARSRSVRASRALSSVVIVVTLVGLVASALAVIVSTVAHWLLKCSYDDDDGKNCEAV